jgi:hypothetical protein
MKKLFIGLLIIAAGAGAFFYLRSKQIKIADSPGTEVKNLKPDSTGLVIDTVAKKDSSPLILKKAE